MSYIKIFKIIILLISSPAKAWEDINLQWDSQKVVVDFVYPMIGFCGLSYLVGSLIRRGWNAPMSFQLAMVDCCGVAVTLFVGFFLAAYIINQVAVRWFEQFSDMKKAQLLAGFGLSITFLGEIVLGIFPDLSFAVAVIELYVFYLIYIGTPILMGIKGSNRIGFTAVSSVILLACPWFIHFIFNKLTILFN